MLRFLTLAVAAGSALLSSPAAAQTNTEQYRQQAEAELEARKSAAERPAKARNVTIFVGDGMGVSTLTAARILAGQSAGVDGESFLTAMDRLDHTALVKPYSHDGQVSDSAPTATAILSGEDSQRRDRRWTRSRGGRLRLGLGAPGTVSPGDGARVRPRNRRSPPPG